MEEGDFFEYEKGTNSFLRWKPGATRGKTTHFWVMANLINGGKPFHVMTADEAMEHGRKHSKSWVTKEYSKEAGKKVDVDPHFVANSPWATDPDLMCLKTTLVQLCKILPLSIELQKAIAADETARDFRKGVDDILDLPDQVSWDKSDDEPNEKKDTPPPAREP